MLPITHDRNLFAQMNTHSKSYFTKLLSVFTLTLFIHTLVAVAFHDKAVAAQVSQAQIDQFKKLPASQQQALAKSMGVDLNGIKKQISAGKVQKNAQATPVYSRGTKFAKSAQPGSTAKTKSKLTPFGYNVFANAPSTFAPSRDIAIPEGYILGVGDTISIQVFGKENMELELAINREGEVVFPSHGPFSIAGLSFIDMKKLLSSKLKEKIIGVDVVIGMASLRSMRVFVLGDAYKPGPYTLSSLSSITHALFAAGGISSIGSLRNIQLKRAGKLVTTLDLYDLLIKGDSTNDLLLQSGDVVFIPPVSQKVAISGLVTRPAIYELASGDTFSSVLNMAGGALPSAHLKYTELKRYSKNSYRRAVNIDLSDEQTIDDLVFGGDEIRVKQTEFLRTPKILPIADAVTLMGAVKKAGKYQWQKGQKVADFLPQIDTHLLDNADLQYALVVREINSARDIEVLQFSLANALLNRNSAANILLQPKDKILVFSNSSRQGLLSPVLAQLRRQTAAGQPLQLTEIDGQVKYPGTYPLAKNARIKDLVVAAGGVEESAYLANAELTRSHIEGITARKQSQRVVLAEVLKGTNSENILLQSKDRLNVHKIPLWSENSYIELRGEFLFPGRYTIRRGDTLSDVIKKAGGLTEFAHVRSAVFSRTRLKALEQKNIKKVTSDLRSEIAIKSMSDSSFLASYPEVKSMVNDLNQLEPVGRLVLELDEVIKDNDYNVPLENGDVLFVPMKKHSVNVVGQVQVSSSHIYSKGLDADDYIAKSGGLKQRADADRVYIIAANGNVVIPEDNNWFSVDKTTILPGDTVVVPLDTEHVDGLTLWSSATQIIYNSAVAIAAISGI